MPRLKKTRTTSTERNPTRNARRLRQARKGVAAETARIMATEGQRNFHTAKKKAAERLGVNSRLALPSNIEVEAALRAYQGLYGGEKLARHLRFLRETAIRVMRALEPFCPRLVGPVLDGTADRHSRVSLHLFSDPPDAIALHLFERGLNYHEEERKIRWHDGSHRRVTLLVTDADGVPGTGPADGEATYESSEPKQLSELGQVQRV